jgi:hypothetical protein
MATPQIDQKEKVKPILLFCSVISIIGLIAGLIHAETWAAAMTTVEWILACLLTGAITGFIFSIPTVVQPPLSTGTTVSVVKAYQQKVNNNLPEISDWLTKIIVGLGLVKLTKIPPYLTGIASTFAAGLVNGSKPGNLPPVAFAYGVIICYFIVGFLFGYLVTRIYLASEISGSEKSLAEVAEQLNNYQAKVDNIDATQSVLTQTIMNAAPPAAEGDRKAILDTLVAKANDYLNISSANYGERVQLKETSVADMSAYAIANRITKTDIINLYKATPNEGLLITLATLINSSPEAGDLDLLINYASNVSRKHVRYRVLTAIGKLISQRLIKQGDKERILALVETYRKNADASLLQKVDSVVAQINSYSF